jgi:hypothetical protein
LSQGIPKAPAVIGFISDEHGIVGQVLQHVLSAFHIAFLSFREQ